MALIEVKNLTKEFIQYRTEPGLKGAIKSIFYHKSTIKRAVDNISFSLEKGELVGYIGPNGAGKSTTIKMLCGVLLPTSGFVRVDELNPFYDRRKHGKNIGVVFGQRSQLWPDLPIGESYNLLKYIYQISLNKFDKQLAFLRELLDLDKFWKIPVRQLSLGQRMRANLAAALLHNPPILFLDEPTVGMDVVVKERFREMMRQLNKELRTTILLATHDLGDVEKTCKRLMIIDEGKIIYDGSIEGIKHRTNKNRLLIVDFEQTPREISLSGDIQVIRREHNRIWFQFSRDEISANQLIADIAENYSIRDLTIQEPDIESVVRDVYEHGIQ